MQPEAITLCADLRRVRAAQQRFFDVINRLSDDDVTTPSRLPGWTVGHVLSHVARNAESHIRRSEAAMRGEIVDQYPGGFAGRAAEIDDGAARTAKELLADVAVSAERLEAIWAVAPERAWERMTRDVGGRERPLHRLPARRWQELEVHVVDLGIGVTHREWSDDFVAAWLPQLRTGVEARLPPGEEVPDAGARDDRDELAWLYGRLKRPDLPALASWA